MAAGVTARAVPAVRVAEDPGARAVPATDGLAFLRRLVPAVLPRLSADPADPLRHLAVPADPAAAEQWLWVRRVDPAVPKAVEDPAQGRAPWTGPARLMGRWQARPLGPVPHAVREASMAGRGPRAAGSVAASNGPGGPSGPAASGRMRPIVATLTQVNGNRLSVRFLDGSAHTVTYDATTRFIKEINGAGDQPAGASDLHQGETLELTLPSSASTATTNGLAASAIELRAAARNYLRPRH